MKHHVPITKTPTTRVGESSLQVGATEQASGMQEELVNPTQPGRSPRASNVSRDTFSSAAQAGSMQPGSLGELDKQQMASRNAQGGACIAEQSDDIQQVASEPQTQSMELPQASQGEHSRDMAQEVLMLAGLPQPQPADMQQALRPLQLLQRGASPLLQEQHASEQAMCLAQPQQEQQHSLAQQAACPAPPPQQQQQGAGAGQRGSLPLQLRVKLGGMDLLPAPTAQPSSSLSGMRCRHALGLEFAPSSSSGRPYIS